MKGCAFPVLFAPSPPPEPWGPGPPYRGALQCRGIQGEGRGAASQVHQNNQDPVKETRSGQSYSELRAHRTRSGSAPRGRSQLSV